MFDRQPVSNTNAQALRSFYSANAGGEVRAKQSAIRSLVGKPANRSESQVDGRRRVSPLLQGDAIARHDCLVEREAWFRAVPLGEITDGVFV